MTTRPKASSDPPISARHELHKLREQSTKVTAQSAAKTREMLRLVHESQDAGVSTVKMLHAQGEQLQRTEEALDGTNENLDKAHVTLANIRRTEAAPCCCICCLHCFHKDPDKKRSSQSKNQPQNNDAKAEGQSPGHPVAQSERNDDGRFFRKVLDTKEEDEIEENLARMSSHVIVLKGIASEMNYEVLSQNRTVDRLNVKAERTQVKLDKATKDTTELVDGNNVKPCCGCVVT